MAYTNPIWETQLDILERSLFLPEMGWISAIRLQHYLELTLDKALRICFAGSSAARW